MIARQKPDLVFLDVQMPGCDGFEVLRSTAAFAPAVVFVTAYDQHAIRAFDVEAVDYLLKPVVASRFRSAVRRAVTRIRASGAGDEAARVRDLLARIPERRVEQIPLMVKGSVVFVKLADIDRVEASDDHVRVYAGRQRYLTRETMVRMEERLGAEFVRVHRSWIVNRHRVSSIKAARSGEYIVKMLDGARVRTGRGYAAAVLAARGLPRPARQV
jgi:two-component system LytT family response regulator